MSRIRQSPGIEFHEIDRSAYQTTNDSSLTDTTTLVMGFADRGDNYDVKTIVSMNDFERKFGIPTPGNEAEKYFYNACQQVISSNGRLLAARLPYANNSLDRFCSVSYSIGRPIEAKTILDYLVEEDGENPSLYDILFFVEEPVDGMKLELEDHVFQQMADLADFVKNSINVEIDNESEFDSTFNGRIETFENLEKVFDDDVQNDKLQGEFSQIRIKFNNFEDLMKKFIMTRCVEDVSSWYESMLACIENHENLSNVHAILNSLRERVVRMQNDRTADIGHLDDTIRTYATISNDERSNSLLTMQQYDRLLVDDVNVKDDTIVIVDVTRSNLEKDEFGNEVFGIMPVITTPVEAVAYQHIFSGNKSSVLEKAVVNKPFESEDEILSFNGAECSVEKWNGTVQNLGNEDWTQDRHTVSNAALDFFPRIQYRNGRLDSVDMKKIGLVVFRVFKDSANGDRVGFLPVEAFVGTLKKGQVDSVTGKKVFIEDVVNQQSKFVNIFVNANQDTVENVETFSIGRQFGTILGFRSEDTKKVISVKTSITDAMTTIFDHCKDLNTVNIDIIVDAGVSTIGQYVASIYENGDIARVRTEQVQAPLSCGCETTVTRTTYVPAQGRYDINDQETANFKLRGTEDVVVWKTIVQKFDDFCRNVRKDCMFIADAPRSFCLEGDQPIVRKSRPDRTVENSILPKLRFISGAVNSSYSAGYCNWFYAVDAMSGDYFWCPPSIKAVTKYLYTDIYGKFWMAPAGMNRGVVEDVYDIAFNPTDKDTWDIYSNQWNYAISYPLEGIVLEGQKTFQTNRTAFDRVNVRRLFLGLEKIVRGYAKYFEYEQNTEWNRQRFVDQISEYFEDVRNGDGLSEYAIVCDENNNTP